jgi:hypothetical protein
MRLVRAVVCAVMLSCLDVLPGTTLFMIIAMAPAAAQQGNLDAIYKRYNELYAAGNYAAALVEAQKFEAGVKARFGVNHAKYGSALNNLAMVYAAQGKYADAEELYKRDLEISEKALGKDHRDVATTLNNLANVYKDQGKYAEAEGLLSLPTGSRDWRLVRSTSVSGISRALRVLPSRANRRHWGPVSASRRSGCSRYPMPSPTSLIVVTYEPRTVPLGLIGSRAKQPPATERGQSNHLQNRDKQDTV